MECRRREGARPAGGKLNTQTEDEVTEQRVMGLHPGVLL